VWLGIADFLLGAFLAVAYREKGKKADFAIPLVAIKYQPGFCVLRRASQPPSLFLENVIANILCQS